MKLANLPWYDLSSQHDGLDIFWGEVCAALRRRGWTALPQHLDRLLPLSTAWLHPDLILSQCCGPDLFSESGRWLKPFARPVFAALDCEPGCYFSHIVTAKKSLPRRVRLAVNATTSYSGHYAARQWLANEGIDVITTRVTGSHLGSIDALLRDEADIAAIDAQTLHLHGRVRGINMIGRGRQAPSPPYVTRVIDCDIADLLESLKAANGRAGGRIGVADIMAAERSDYAELIGPRKPTGE